MPVAPPLFPAEAAPLPDDFIGVTFVLTLCAMLAAAAFFFYESFQVSTRWRPSMRLSGVITAVSSANYVLMSMTWLSTHVRPLEWRYLDWILTVPLICVQFYLLLRTAGARPGQGMVWRLVGASAWMLGFGYVGQVIEPERTFFWGAVSTVGYALVLFEVSLGEARLAAGTGEAARIRETYGLLFYFIFLGWAIYPLAYMTATGNLLERWHDSLPFPVLYNLGDALNKIGFGLVIWKLAVSRGEEAARVSAG